MKKGQIAGNVTDWMLALLIIGVVAFVTMRVYSNLNDSIDLSSSTKAVQVSGNFSSGFWDAFGLISIAPYIIGALVVLTLILGFTRVVGVGRL